MSSWASDDEWTEPQEGDDRTLMGVTGGQRTRPGDSYVLGFHDDGEEVETDSGERIKFSAELVESDFSPVDGDGAVIEDGEEIVFMTGSKRFLGKLSEHDPVGGKTLRVMVIDTGYDAEYDIEEYDG